MLSGLEEGVVIGPTECAVVTGARRVHNLRTF